jgi:hypothetical protein
MMGLSALRYRFAVARTYRRFGGLLQQAGGGAWAFSRILVSMKRYHRSLMRNQRPVAVG